MGHDGFGRGRVVVANIVDGAGPRLAHRGGEHLGQIVDMDARKDLAGLIDPARGPGAQCVKRAAARAVDGGEPKYVNRQAAVAPKLEPALLGLDPAPAALAARLERRCLVDPPSAAIAIDAGCRQIAEPSEPGQRADVAPMGVENRVAASVGRDGHQHTRDPIYRPGRQRAVAIKRLDGKASAPELGRLFVSAAGAAYDPALGGDKPRQCARAVAEAKAEQVRRSRVHDGCSTAASGSASSVSAMRFCLTQVAAQKPQETIAPTASGRRSPKRSLNEPINTAPNAGPARKIMP